MGNAAVLIPDEIRIVVSKGNPCEVDYCREKSEENRREKERRRPEETAKVSGHFSVDFLEN
jgi:hypothetical protein